MNDDSDTVRRRQVRYRAWHRGTREMDLLLGTYADTHVPDMSGPDLDRFERLLDVPDQELFVQVAGQGEPAAEFAGIVGQLRAMRFVPADYT